MRGQNNRQDAMFSYISLDSRIPQDHPLRPIRRMADEALKGLSPLFDELYSAVGRPSVPPEHLLRVRAHGDHPSPLQLGAVDLFRYLGC